MEAEMKVKCSHYNKGYCKYKERGCKYLHPKDQYKEQKCRDKNCTYRHLSDCKFKNQCKFLKLNKCEFKHNTVFQSEVFKTSPNLSKEKGLENYVKMFQDILSKKEASLKEKEMVVEDKDAQLERVTEQLKISEENFSKIRIEVFELEKQNKEKMILIKDLSFKIENTNTEEDCSNCKETNQLTTNFNNLRSK